MHETFDDRTRSWGMNYDVLYWSCLFVLWYLQRKKFSVRNSVWSLQQCIIKILLPLKERVAIEGTRVDNIRSSPWLVAYYYNWRELFTVRVQTLWPKRGGNQGWGEGTKAMKLSNITHGTEHQWELTLLSSLLPGLLAIAFCHLQYVKIKAA